MSSTVEKRTSPKVKVPASSIRHTADQTIESERPGSGPSTKQTANSHKAAPFREDRQEAWSRCTDQMQMISALAWI
jgi:hypothetical protein